MIAFIGYVSAISLLLVAAATASEPLIRAVRLPTRSVWLAAMCGSVFVALAARWAPPSIAPVPVIGTTIDRSFVEGSAVPVAPLAQRNANSLELRSGKVIGPATEMAPDAPDTALMIAGCWLVVSLGCLAWLLVGIRRVARIRRSCRTGWLGGEQVLVSDIVGPAVLGVLRHRIVIPRWVQELDEAAQRLILAHEREHVRARDPLVLHLAVLPVVLMPWNIAFWFALHRLRSAIEIDCDARVLRGQRATTKDYCQLLLEVGERTVAVARPLLALAEPATLLERRIESMMTTRKLRDWKTLVPAAGAMLLLAGACRAPRPEIAPAQRFGGMARALSNAMTTSTRSAPRTPTSHSAMEHPLAAPTVQTPVSHPQPGGATLSRTAIGPRDSTTFPAAASVTDTTVRNEEALRRSAEEHQAHIDALADSVILASYPELTHRAPGTPAFLALVLDDREKVMRHAISLDTALPNDLAAIMLALHVDTISSRTLGLGISSNNPWSVTVGHAVEALGPARGRSEMRVSLTSPRPYSLRRVPYQRIVDSVARARNPEAYQEHEGTFAIAMLLDEAGHLMRYGAEPHADPSVASEHSNSLMTRLIGDSTRTGDIAGVAARLRPSKTVIVWGVRR